MKKKFKLKVIPITGWSPTKLFSHEECAYRCQLQHALHLCPKCFRGTVPYEGACDACGAVPVKPAPLAKGIAQDVAMEAYLLPGKGPARGLSGEAFADTIHPVVLKMASEIKRAVRAGSAEVQKSLVFDSHWTPVSQFTKNAWLRIKLDVLRKFRAAVRVLDWKSGGIDKKTNQIKENENYQKQLDIYSLGSLITNPGAGEASSCLVFTDAPLNVHPVVSGRTITRTEIKTEMKYWEGRVQPMLTDTVFAPRPGWYCGWNRDGERQGCPYEKQKGGPCVY